MHVCSGRHMGDATGNFLEPLGAEECGTELPLLPLPHTAAAFASHRRQPPPTPLLVAAAAAATFAGHSSSQPFLARCKAGMPLPVTEPAAPPYVIAAAVAAAVVVVIAAAVDAAAGATAAAATIGCHEMSGELGTGDWEYGVWRSSSPLVVVTPPLKVSAAAAAKERERQWGLKNKTARVSPMRVVSIYILVLGLARSDFRSPRLFWAYSLS